MHTWNFPALAACGLLSGTLMVAACGDQPTSPAVAPAPTFNHGSSHAAIVFISRNSTETCFVFDGDGQVAAVDCDDVTVAVTQSANGNFVINGHTMVPNNSGQPVRYDSNNNPIGAGLPCAFPVPGGGLLLTDQWFMHVSASGKLNVKCWGRA